MFFPPCVSAYLLQLANLFLNGIDLCANLCHLVSRCPSRSALFLAKYMEELTLICVVPQGNDLVNNFGWGVSLL